MEMIKRKWALNIRHREKLEPEYKCFGNDTNDLESKYDLKYFLLNRDKYSIDHLYKILNKEYSNLENYIYKINKNLYYDIVSWTLFKEWINIYVKNIYPNYDSNFVKDYKIIRTKKIYKNYANPFTKHN